MYHLRGFQRKNTLFLQLLSREKLLILEVIFIKTGLHKKQKETAITFDESSEVIDVFTHNTDLRKRLLEYAEKYPEYCSLTDSDEKGGMRFEVRKGRLSFRLTAPYSDEMEVYNNFILKLL